MSGSAPSCPAAQSLVKTTAVRFDNSNSSNFSTKAPTSRSKQAIRSAYAF